MSNLNRVISIKIQVEKQRIKENCIQGTKMKDVERLPLLHASIASEEVVHAH